MTPERARDILSDLAALGVRFPLQTSDVRPGVILDADHRELLVMADPDGEREKNEAFADAVVQAMNPFVAKLADPGVRSPLQISDLVRGAVLDADHRELLVVSEFGCGNTGPISDTEVIADIVVQILNCFAALLQSTAPEPIQ